MFNSSIVKSSFIQFSSENTRVIDPNALMAKRMEGFTGVFRERDDSETDEEGYDAVDALTDSEFSGEFVPMEGAEGAFEPEPEEETISPEELIAAANAEAERIIEAANAEANEIRETAKNEGYEAGYSEGREVALSELLEAKNELEGEREAIKAEYESLMEEAEPRMVDTITDIYEYVFGSNFYSRRDVMVCLINKALLHSEADDQIVIHVSAADYDMLVGMKNAILDKVSFQNEPEFRQREDFVKGQAKVETPYGLLDCSIDTELKELKRMLRLLSYEGRGEA